MTSPMMPLYNLMTQSWSPYFYALMAQYQKKLGMQNIFFLPHLHPSSFSSNNVLSSKSHTSLFSVPNNFYFPIKALIDVGAFCSALPLNNFKNSRKAQQV